MMASLADNETETTYGVAPVAYAGFHDDESVNSGDNDITIISDDNDATRLYIDPALLGKSVPLMDEIMLARSVSTAVIHSSEESVVGISDIVSSKHPIAEFKAFLDLFDELASFENHIVETPADPGASCSLQCLQWVV